MRTSVPCPLDWKASIVHVQAFSRNSWTCFLVAFLGFDERRFLPCCGDVGTGETHLIWESATSLGDAFDRGEAESMHPYLVKDQGSDKLLQDIAFGGVKLGIGFRSPCLDRDFRGDLRRNAPHGRNKIYTRLEGGKT